MAAIQSFRDLNVYQEARSQARAIFEVSCGFPRDERFSLIDQIRRSSRSVCAMLAEAWGRRRYEAAFIDKVSQALAEAMETQAWLDQALDCDYIDSEAHTRLDCFQHIGAMLQRMIDRASDFCRKRST